MGAPRAKLNYQIIDQLLIEGNSGRQIAGYLGINNKTLYDNVLHDKAISFSEYADQFNAKGETLLKTKQHEIAMKGNVTMLIWLGKQRCDQKERIEKETIIPNDILISKDHEIMQLKNKIALLEKNNGNKSETR